MTEFKKMKVQELRDELESRGLDTSGTKPVLLERLEEALNKTVATPTDAAPAVTAPPVTAPPVAVKETAPPATESQPPVAAAPVRRASLHTALVLLGIASHTQPLDLTRSRPRRLLRQLRLRRSHCPRRRGQRRRSGRRGQSASASLCQTPSSAWPALRLTTRDCEHSVQQHH